MASPYKLHIPPCVHDPPHTHHPPLPLEKALRIQIEGPLVAIQRLLPPADAETNSSSWTTRAFGQKFPQPAGLEFARLAYHAVYGRYPRSVRINQLEGEAPKVIIDGDSDNDGNILVIRNEYLSWTEKNKIPHGEIDYYGITIDNHLVPLDDPNPEVLQINILELETGNETDNNDDNEPTVGVAFANKHLLFEVDPAEYIGQKILAVPRCCQKRKGSTDRGRVNSLVLCRDGRKDEADRLFG